ncbi:hypothetical protein ACOMHN_019993 [Nucella lapillus]
MGFAMAREEQKRNDVCHRWVCHGECTAKEEGRLSQMGLPWRVHSQRGRTSVTDGFAMASAQPKRKDVCHRWVCHGECTAKEE